MQPIGENARLLSNDVLAKWLGEDFPFRIQLAPVFPFLPVAGDSLRYATTGPLPPAATIGQFDSIPEDTKQPIDPNRVHRFAEIATHFRVGYKAQDIFSSNINVQVAVQMALAVRVLLYKFWILFESGDLSVNADEFDGLLRLVDPCNIVDLKGRGLRLEDLDRAKEMIRANDGRGVMIYTNSIGKRAVHAAYWGRSDPEYEAMEFALPDGSTLMQQVLKFDGAPVYINDLNQVYQCEGGQPQNIISAEQVRKLDGFDPPLATNIWFFVLGPGHLHGIIPEQTSEDQNEGTSSYLSESLPWISSLARHIKVRSTILADGSTLVYHLTLPVGIALGSLGALAVIKNATIPTGAGTNQKP